MRYSVGGLRALWTSSLNLPVSSFPARPLPTTHYVNQCSDELYAWQLRRDSHDKTVENTFILHDGPPYANGELHLGHAVNKILKDVICRYNVTRGKRIQYIPGWDCHGLPIELKALQSIAQRNNRCIINQNGTSIEDYRSLNAVAIRKCAETVALETIEAQKSTFRSWAIMADWDKAYKSLDVKYIVAQLEIFKQMVANQLIYHALKPVYWSGSSGTALAESELEYNENHTSTCALVGYRLFNILDNTLEDNPSSTFAADPYSSKLDPGKPVYALVWTTTPWTLPANKAIGVGPHINYCLVEITTEGLPTSAYFIIAVSRLQAIHDMLDVKASLKVVSEHFSGAELLKRNLKYINMLQEPRAHTQHLIESEFVLSDVGTGLVHMAPGHGLEDFEVCLKRVPNMEAFAPIDDYARFTSEALPASPDVLRGKCVLGDGMRSLIDYIHMQQQGVDGEPKLVVLATHSYKHSYPIDWRTKQPVVIRATRQWFANVDAIKETCIDALKYVRFVPESGRVRLTKFLLKRSDWCISRQRVWGVPIPALYYTDTSGHLNAVMDEAVINRFIQVISTQGVDSWWTEPHDSTTFIPDGFYDKYNIKPTTRVYRGTDTMDVWFDSGTSWSTLLNGNIADDAGVADVYIEGSDQHRGWFQSSLLTFVAWNLQQGIQGARAPFKTLITHGFTLDRTGRKMSKSIGNTVSPWQIINNSLTTSPSRQKRGTQGNLGIDVLRIWVVSNDFTRDIHVNEDSLQTARMNLSKYRVTFKWLTGVLNNFTSRETYFDNGSFHHSFVETTCENYGGLASFLDKFSLPDQLALFHLHVTSQKIYQAYENFEFARVVQLINRYVYTDLSSFYFESIKDRLYAGLAHGGLRSTAQEVCVCVLTNLLEILAPLVPCLVSEVHQHTKLSFSRTTEFPSPVYRVWNPFNLLPALDFSREQLAKLVVKEYFVELLNSAVQTLCERARQSHFIRSNLDCELHLNIKLAPDHIFTPVTSDVASASVTPTLSWLQILMDRQCGSLGYPISRQLADIFGVSIVHLNLILNSGSADSASNYHTGEADCTGKLKPEMESTFSHLPASREYPYEKVSRDDPSTSDSWSFHHNIYNFHEVLTKLGSFINSASSAVYDSLIPPSIIESDLQSTSMPHQLRSSCHILLRPATRHKCPRCWKRIAPQPDNLCHYCSQIIDHTPLQT